MSHGKRKSLPEKEKVSRWKQLSGSCFPQQNKEKIKTIGINKTAYTVLLL